MHACVLLKTLQYKQTINPMTNHIYTKIILRFMYVICLRFMKKSYWYDVSTNVVRNPPPQKSKIIHYIFLPYAAISAIFLRYLAHCGRGRPFTTDFAEDKQLQDNVCYFWQFWRGIGNALTWCNHFPQTTVL